MIAVKSRAVTAARIVIFVTISQSIFGGAAHSADNSPKPTEADIAISQPLSADTGNRRPLNDAPKPVPDQPPANITPPAQGDMPNGLQPAPAPGPKTPPGGSQTGTNTQQFLTVDLATPGTYARNAGTYTLRFVNKVPKANYTISSTVVSRELPAAFDASAFTLTPKPEPGARGVDPKCQVAVNKLRDALAGMRCESDVSALRATYKVQLQQLSDGTCTDSDTATANSAVTALTEWSESDPLPALADGDSVNVTVNRIGEQCTSDDPHKFKTTSVANITSGPLGTWTFNIGKVESQWLVYYGFNFAPDGNAEYFSKANPGTNPPTYTITRKASTHGSSFSPSVYVLRLPGEDGFSWRRFAGWRAGDYMGGLTAGLGFDFDNPTVFLGYGIGWGFNVMVTAGVVMRKVDRLNGQYSAGQVISENLTPDQLVQATYKPQAYIGLAFRFGSNPFKSSSSAKSTATGK